MSGHSKWKNIMHKKGKTDAQRAKLFTKFGREIAAIVKAGGPDPIANPRLRDAIAKAKQNNVPNDNIERVIKKASGGGDNTEYFDIIYEGYGPKGLAVIVETLTDNRNRTAADMRHAFDKFGGNMGTSGSVSWQFETKGMLALECAGLDRDKLEEDIIEAGASDFTVEDGVYEILTDAAAFDDVYSYLLRAGYNFLSAELTRIPGTYVDLTEEDDVKMMTRMLEAFEDSDDVQNVYHNWGNEPQEEEE